MMTTRSHPTHRARFALSAAALATGIAALSAVAQDTQPAPPTSPQFEMIKALVGTWEGTVTHGEEPEDAAVTYALTAGGSAVVETVFPDTEQEMVTVYHMDGDDLVLTHYCMLANQPRMVARPGDETEAITFVFDGGANIPSEDVTHMHEATHTFPGEDRLVSQWTLYVEGEPAQTAKLDLHRKSSER